MKYFYSFFFCFFFRLFGTNDLKCQNSKHYLNSSLNELNIKGSVKSLIKVSYSVLLQGDSIVIDELSASTKDIEQQSNVLCYNFNNKGNTESIKYFNSLDTLTEPDAFESFNFYNDKLIETKYLNYKNNVNYIKTYSFDINNKLIKILENNRNRNYQYKYVYKNTYDNLNRLVEIKQFDGTNVIEKTYRYAKFKLKYNNKNQLFSEFAYFPNDKLAYFDNFIYDSHNNVISKKRYFSINSEPVFEVSFKYIYDSQGNWIQRIEFFNQTSTYLIKRTINYFTNK
jgi:hypothetical protein